MEDYKFLKLKVNKKVGIVHINRPPANALNMELVEELHSVIDELTIDESVRAVVFTGQGSFFVAGADIKMMQERKNHDLSTFIEAFTVHLQRAYNKIEKMQKPVIAAINGYAAGGGCELALACDFRFMAKGRETIGLPEVRLGLLPGAGGLQRMPRIIGKAKALELITQGKQLTAEEAYNIGLVNKIYPKDDLLTETLSFAKEMAKGPTVAIGKIKRCINYGMDADITAALSHDIEAQDMLFRTEDAIEGIEAFVQKRPASFKGK